MTERSQLRWAGIESPVPAFLSGIQSASLSEKLSMWRCVFDPELFVSTGSKHSRIIADASLGSAITKRQAEFCAGRLLCEMALGQDVIVSRGKDGQPIWPLGYSGSISHSGNQVYIIVGQGKRWIGLDVEAMLSDNALIAILKRALTDAESTWIRSLKAEDRRHAATLIFSAKEALFKSVYPEFGQYFGFQAAEIASEPDQHSIEMALTVNLSDHLFKGKVFQFAHSIENDYVVTWTSDLL